MLTPRGYGLRAVLCEGGPIDRGRPGAESWAPMRGLLPLWRLDHGDPWLPAGVRFARTEVRVTPEQATAKWTSRLQAATTEMTQGVARVQQAPGAAAAAKFDKWMQGIQQNAEKWRRNVNAVTLQQWQQSMTSIGIPRVGEGAAKKAGKYTAFAQDFYPFLQQQMVKVNAMPDNTFEARLQKAQAMAIALHAYKRGGSSGVGAPPAGA